MCEELTVSGEDLSTLVTWVMSFLVLILHMDTHLMACKGLIVAHGTRLNGATTVVNLVNAEHMQVQVEFLWESFGTD